jgi:predicted Zn finger-like uncharacterized protein
VKISCPSCSAKYSIADEKVQNRLAKIRCRKCGTSIVIDGNVSPAAVFAGEVEGDAPRAGAPAGGFAQAASPASATVYTVDFGENDQRQMSVPDLVAAYNAGQVTGETYLWADGFADWTPLAQIDEIVAALNAATGVDETSAAGASTAPNESPWADSAANRAQATPGPVAVAARGADLFGGIDRAGAEAEIATSASGSSTAGAGGGFGPTAAAGTGARNESSVLFSLSALTAAAGTSRPNNLAPVVPTQHVTEDSGLIDLKALTAAAEHHRPLAAAPVAAAPLGLGGGLPLGGAPLGSPYGGLSTPSLPPQRAKSNTALYIGILAVAAVLGAVLIFRLTEKEAAPPLPPVPTSAPIAAPAPLPPPMPTSATLPTAEAKAPTTGDAEGETSPAKSGTTAKKTTKTTSSGSSSTSSTSSSSSSGTATPPPKKKSGGGGCGCAANDLMCNMRCSSK